FTGEIDSKYIGSDITIGVRPQQIKASPNKEKNSTIPGTVRIVEFQGDSEVLSIELSDTKKTETKVVIAAGGYRFKRGETCWLEFEPKFTHLFNNEENAIIKR
ncbi:MAG: TOBE domain-containing protein, partial [Actinobacteria bacterium]|nr:TOBE domain-containing protein [Actinomycetota bacterium]